MCCFPFKKSWTKDIKAEFRDIKPKPKINSMVVKPLFEGNSPKHDPCMNNKVYVVMDSINIKVIQEFKITMSGEYKS